jgi:hypothetical protein
VIVRRSSLKRVRSPDSDTGKGELHMLDLIYIAVTILFFLIALVYVRGCEKLQ